MRDLSIEYGKLKQYFAGMEITIKSLSPPQIGDKTHVLLKDPLLYLTKTANLALNLAASASMTRNPMLANNEFILEQGKEAWNSLDEALAFVLESIYSSNIHSLYKNKPSSPLITDHELRSINSEDLDEGRQDSFKHHLPMLFFLFSMKHLWKEATNILLHYSAPCAKRVQQIAARNPDSEYTEGVNYCPLCALPLRTISIRVDALREESKSKYIWQFLCKLIGHIHTNRVIIALKCSLSLGLSVLFGILCSQQRGYRAGIAVAIGMGCSRESTFKLANIRAQGTAAGSVYAVIASSLTGGCIIMRTAALIPWVIFTSFLRQSKTYGYAGGLSAFIAAVVILGQKDVEHPSEFAIVRTTETFIGIGCYILIELTLQPRRASTLARKELVIGLCSLRDFTISLVSAQIRRGCVHSYALALLELKEKQKRLKSHICRLRNYIEEAKVEPDFWFLPFPSSIYSKLLESYCKIEDLLHFATLSYESIIESCASNNLSVERIYGVISDDLQAFESRVSKGFQSLTKLTMLTRKRQHIARLEHSEDSRSPSIHNHDVNCGIYTIKEQNPNSDYNSVLICQNSYNIAGDEDITHSLIKNVQEAVTDIMRLADQDEIICSNDFVMSLSALAFCLENIINESRQVEKAVHELLQWENPWSSIDLWEIYETLNSRAVLSL